MKGTANHQTGTRLDAPWGFQVWFGQPKLMRDAHQHQDVEINFLLRGSVRYVIAASTVTLRPGKLHVFWGATPHQLISMDAGTEMAWITIPLKWLYRWQLPSAFSHDLLAGHMLADRAALAGELDNLYRWHDDLASGNADRARAAALEVEARLHRMAIASPRPRKPRKSRKLNRMSAASRRRRPLHPTAAHGDRIERMISFMVERFDQPLRVEDVARQVDLHPNYAMTLFRRHTGLSVIEYLTRLRIWHAQRLLVSTDQRVLEIAYASGFGSASRFYEAFSSVCGQSPNAYRASVHG
ncbi:MAG: helix-turn-helix domain-containing protein [Phycisphaeraceae bacterium]|nr:helix-turn-helix domain-containing protein [Phycisphaeraceae bacterium]